MLANVRGMGSKVIGGNPHKKGLIGSMARIGDEKIDLMHKKYGVPSGVKCKTCPHLDVHGNADRTRVWYKCHMFGVSNGEATDWRVGNEACGAFNVPVEYAVQKGLYGRVFKQVKGLKKPVIQEELPGQITMTELLA